MTEALWAAVGAGVTALLTRIVGKYIDRDNETIQQGKSLRDELREDIERLEGRIKVLDDKVNHLEAEVDAWKAKVDEWRVRYYELLEKYQVLKVTSAAKDQIIERLRERLKALEEAKK